MRAVARGAVHLAFGHRHVRRTAHLAFHIFVALIACLARIGLNKFAVTLGAVKTMTIRAGHVGPIVGASGPMGPLRVFMTFHTCLLYTSFPPVGSPVPVPSQATHSASPVSYTHLDVYKRQRLNPVVSWSCKLLRAYSIAVGISLSL